MSRADRAVGKLANDLGAVFDSLAVLREEGLPVRQPLAYAIFLFEHLDRLFVDEGLVGPRPPHAPGPSRPLETTPLSFRVGLFTESLYAEVPGPSTSSAV